MENGGKFFPTNYRRSWCREAGISGCSRLRGSFTPSAPDILFFPPGEHNSPPPALAENSWGSKFALRHGLDLIIDLPPPSLVRAGNLARISSYTLPLHDTSPRNRDVIDRSARIVHFLLSTAAPCLERRERERGIFWRDSGQQYGIHFILLIPYYSDA